MYLVDSNILVYAYDRSEGKKRERAKKLLEECWKRKRKLALSVQNLSEFFVAVTENIEKPISKSKAGEIVSDFIQFENWVILNPNPDAVLSAIQLSREQKVPYWDALIAAVMLQNRIFRIYTEDEDFEKIEQITSENPLQ